MLPDPGQLLLLSLPVRQIHPSAWLLVLVSAVLQALIFPLPGLYVLSWFALAPLIVALLRARPAGELEVAGSMRLRAASPWQGFLLGYLCGILWYAATCYWIYDTMRHFGGLTAPEALLALFLFCCYLGLYHGLFGLLLSMLAGPRDYRRALVTAPFLWVAVELARTRITGFPWNLLGIAQVDNVALSRIAAWTGVYGVSFRDRSRECRAGRRVLDSASQARRHARRSPGSGSSPAGRKVRRASSGNGRSCCSARTAEYPSLRRLDSRIFPADVTGTDRTDSEVCRHQVGVSQRAQDRSDRLAGIPLAIFYL